MKLLLDVNTLVAMLDPLHVHHEKANVWYGGLRASVKFLTCPTTELGLVRVLMQTNAVAGLRDAQAALVALKAAADGRITFIADDLGAASLPTYVKTARQTTDGHLWELARRHGAKLATFDQGIPGVELIS